MEQSSRRANVTSKQIYIMGIDLGTQSAKVVIFRPNGDVVCEGKQSLRPLAIPKPQLAEHPDDDLWDALKAACKAAMTEFRKVGQDDQIRAVGLCTIRCCRVLLRKDGRLAYPVINWMDKRLNDPYKYENTFGDVSYVTTTSGYITHRLTGETKDTSANYIGWWPMDDETFEWSTDPKSFAMCGLNREMVFDVVKPGEILGEVTRTAAEATGLPAGLPVVATAHDKAVEMLGAGLLDSSVAQISLGTYIGAFVAAEKRISDAKGFWTFQSSKPGGYMYECMGVRRGMWTVSWFRDQFGGAASAAANAAGIPIEEYFNREGAKVSPGSDGLITVHDWAPPPEAPYRKGVMLGFDGRHTSAHMYRSLLEGIGMTLYNSMQEMLSELQVDLPGKYDVSPAQAGILATVRGIEQVQEI